MQTQLKGGIFSISQVFIIILREDLWIIWLFTNLEQTEQLRQLSPWVDRISLNCLKKPNSY